jgi:phosphomannomutase
MFHHAVLAALQSVGCDVIDVGLAPTPTIQLAVEHAHAAGGLAITASHNPIEWNALKFIGPSGLFLDGAEGAEMRQMVDHGFPRATWDQLGSVEPDRGAIERHIERVLALPFIDVEAIRKRRFRVALDCVRGAGGVIMPALLERLGCEVAAINLETDGRFPRPPEPVAANLGGLEQLVKASGAEVGLATDPDVDRLALVSDKGRAIGEDWTLALAARLVLRYRPGPVVVNLSTSRIVDDVAAETGAQVLRAPVGEVIVAVRMRVLHGELNGGRRRKADVDHIASDGLQRREDCVVKHRSRHTRVAPHHDPPIPIARHGPRAEPRGKPCNDLGSECFANSAAHSRDTDHQPVVHALFSIAPSGCATYRHTADDPPAL